MVVDVSTWYVPCPFADHLAHLRSRHGHAHLTPTTRLVAQTMPSQTKNRGMPGAEAVES